MPGLSIYIERNLARLTERVSAAAVPGGRLPVAYRQLLGLFLLFFHLPQFTYLSQLPAELFQPFPLSLAGIFPTSPGAATWLAIEGLLAGAAAALTLGWRPRVAGGLFALGYTFGHSYLFALGKINHHGFLLLVLVGGSLIGWERGTYRAYRLYGTAVAVLLCFAMLYAGQGKVRNWIDFDLATSGLLNWYFEGYYLLERRYLLAPFVPHAPAWIRELADGLAALFEVVAVICLVAGRRWWLGWLLMAGVFHLTTTLLLNIPFEVHAVVYLLFLPIPIHPHLSRVVVYGLVALGVGFRLAQWLLAARGTTILSGWLPVPEEAVLAYLGVGLWSSFVLVVLHSLYKPGAHTARNLKPTL